jgi:hypothetical protein
MNLNALKVAIRLCLGVEANGTQLSDTELEQAIELSLTAINRYFPRERIATHVWTKTITDEAILSVAAHATAISLTNKPIEFGSEVVTSSPAGTTYVKDTDYEMDYINGTIQTLASGAMGLSTAFLIDYTRDPNSLDVSSILTNPINIQKLDIRSGSENPREIDGWSLWGDTLLITAQRSLADNHHINIYYRGMHTGPTDTSSGSFPRFLDEILVIGASGYALIIEGESRRHQSVTDLASSRTSLGSIAAIHTSIATARTALAVTQGDINTALDAVVTTLGSVGARVTSAANTLILASSSLAKYDTASTGPIDKATTDFANAVIGLGDVSDPRISNILDKVATHATTSGGSKDAVDAVDAIITAMGTDITAIGTSITALNTDISALAPHITAMTASAVELKGELETATTGAAAYLTAGDDFLNKINNAQTVPSDYVSFARAKIDIANAYLSESNIRTSALNSQSAVVNARNTSIAATGASINARGATINSRLGESTEYLKLSQIFISEVASRLNHVQMYLSSGSAKLAISDRHIASATASVGIALRYIDVVNSHINHAQTYIQQATSRVQEAQVTISDITSLLTQISMYQSEADRYISTADRELLTGDSLRIQGEYYIASFIAALQARQAQVIRQRQTATPYAGTSRGGRNLTGSEA